MAFQAKHKTNGSNGTIARSYLKRATFALAAGTALSTLGLSPAAAQDQKPNILNMPKLTNLRQDPFERMNWPSNAFAGGSIAYWDIFRHEMWRSKIPAQVIAEYAPSLVEYPPLQEAPTSTSAT